MLVSFDFFTCEPGAATATTISEEVIDRFVTLVTVTFVCFEKVIVMFL